MPTFSRHKRVEILISSDVYARGSLDEVVSSSWISHLKELISTYRLHLERTPLRKSLAYLGACSAVMSTYLSASITEPH